MRLSALPTENPDAVHSQRIHHLLRRSPDRSQPRCLKSAVCREITFRQVGEGERASLRDLDRFDQHYDHLLLWNREKRELVGAYRIAKTRRCDRPKRMGTRGLYTRTLFRLRGDFYEAGDAGPRIGPVVCAPRVSERLSAAAVALEGIRDAVATFPEIQNPVRPRQHQQRLLLVLPRADGDVPEIPTRRRKYDVAASGRGKRVSGSKSQRKAAIPCNFSSLLSDLDELSAVVGDLESDQKGIPVLLQQYLRNAGRDRILEFSVDRQFSNVLDGLIVVDLANAKRRQLDRYMGKENAERFLARHSAQNELGGLTPMNFVRIFPLVFTQLSSSAA